MPTQKLALEPQGEKRLEISWKGIWKNMSVKLDGNELGTIANQKELKVGRQFPMPDGGILSVQLVTKAMSPVLTILHNGEPLPGSASDPTTKLKTAAGVTYFIGGLNLVLGLVAEFGKVELLLNLGMGVYSIFFGIFFLFMAFFVNQRSMIALGLAVLVFVVDGGLSMAMVMEAGGTPPVGGIVFRVFLVIAMVQGFGAIKALKE